MPAEPPRPYHHGDLRPALLRAAVEVIGQAGPAAMVAVTDDGPGPADPAAAIRGGGTGLAGLRERARLLGGQLEAGSAAERGFAVRAFLPGPT